MTHKVLVTFATGAGSTAGVAEAIARTLAEIGLEPTLRPISEAGSPEGYHAVVLGSAVRVGRWLPEAVSWLHTHKAALAECPVALFSVCLSRCEDKAEGVEAIRAYVAQEAQGLQTLDQEIFAGAFDPKRLPFLMRGLLRLMRAREGDHRDWAAIEDWANKIGLSLGAP